MKRILAIAAILFAAATAKAAEPLIIVRFNQPHVYYDQQIYNAISKAVAIKPDLLIDVVSIAPETNDAHLDAQWQAAASGHTREVVGVLQSIGVPLSRITISGQRMNGIQADETHIFVR